MSIETYELELEETRQLINRCRVGYNSFKRDILEGHIRFLKSLLEGENDTDKMFALLSAIRGIEEYLEN